MSERLVVLLLAGAAFVGVGLFYVKGQLEGCRSLTSCQIQQVSNGCKNILRWTRCDGSLGYREALCSNSGCVTGCECECDVNGYGQGWFDSCTQTGHSVAYECSGCPSCDVGLAESCIDSLGMWDEETCYCDHSIGPHTPIIIDLAGDGFDLTNAVDGVNFDFYGNGNPIRLGWTAALSNEAFLALDRNENGAVDDGSELFGNFTPQSNGEPWNGFRALAEYDKPENGGNLDAQIDRGDAVFGDLKLWSDLNHNGISEASELRTLADSAIRVIDLNYSESRRIDEHGNQFRYRSRVLDRRGVQVGRWAYDVFLVSNP